MADNPASPIDPQDLEFSLEGSPTALSSRPNSDAGSDARNIGVVDRNIVGGVTKAIQAGLNAKKSNTSERAHHHVRGGESGNAVPCTSSDRSGVHPDLDPHRVDPDIDPDMDPIALVVGHLKRTSLVEEEMRPKMVNQPIDDRTDTIDEISMRMKTLPAKQIFFSRKEWSAAEIEESKRHVVIDGNVYDIAKFKHPGGQRIMTNVVGTDASEDFHLKHHKGTRQLRFIRLVGTLKEGESVRSSSVKIPRGKVSDGEASSGALSGDIRRGSDSDATGVLSTSGATGVGARSDSSVGIEQPPMQRKDSE